MSGYFHTLGTAPTVIVPWEWLVRNLMVINISAEVEQLSNVQKVSLVTSKINFKPKIAKCFFEKNLCITKPPVGSFRCIVGSFMRNASWKNLYCLSRSMWTDFNSYQLFLSFWSRFVLMTCLERALHKSRWRLCFLHIKKLTRFTRLMEVYRTFGPLLVIGLNQTCMDDIYSGRGRIQTCIGRI